MNAAHGFHSMSESRRMHLQLAGQTTEQLLRLEESWAARCTNTQRDESTDPVLWCGPSSKNVETQYEQ